MTKPVLVRADGSIGPAGLKLIEQMAAEHKTQRTIAAAFGMPLKRFEKLMEKSKGENEVRLAWERGFAVFDQHVTDKIRGVAFGDVIEAEEIGEDGLPIIDPETGEKKKVRVQVPVSKAQTIAMIFFAKSQMGWTEKPQGALVQDNRIQITIPAPLSFGQLMHGLGATGLQDFRKDKTVPLKDVTPSWARLEPPKDPEGSQ